MKTAAVTGAGIGGIASAIRLAAKGFRVDVYEAHDKPGGKIAEFYQQGFRFDTGPSLFTMPRLVEELFELMGEKPEDWFRYSRLNNVTRYFFEDGTQINAYADPGQLAEEVEAKTGDKAEQIRKYLKQAAELYGITANVFIFNPFRFKTFVGKDGRSAGLKLHKLDAFRSLHQVNAGFFTDKRLVQLFDRYATYNGSNPYKTPGTLKIISHLEHNMGAFFPEKGMYAIVSALISLAKRHGVRFYFNTRVARFNIKKRRVQSMVVEGKELSYDIYVSNIDIFRLYNQHLEDFKLPKKLAIQELSTSAMIFYWGMRHNYDALDLHNILFARVYQTEFNALFTKHTIPEDPTVYIFISSRQVAGDAPEGRENWYVMINAPADYGQNWEQLREKARDAIIHKIYRMLGYDIRQDIIFERVSDPQEIASRTGAYRGALYGNSSNSRFSAFLRHGNTSRAIKNMYFTGGSVHPGGGIPLCLASAKIAVNEAVHT